MGMRAKGVCPYCIPSMCVFDDGRLHHVCVCVCLMMVGCIMCVCVCVCVFDDGRLHHVCVCVCVLIWVCDSGGLCMCGVSGFVVHE